MNFDSLPYPELLWAGTDQSLTLAINARNEILAGVFGDRQSAREEEQKVPYLFSQQGDIGVVTVRGPLVNDDSPYNRYFDITSYSDIRAAMIHGATSTGVKALVLDIASGGGAVSGVDDTATLIAKIGREIKPVYAFADGPMMSAAYWLGASASGGVYLSRTSVMGSIGVITTHKDYSKMFKEAGIGVSVLRAGKYKALANPNEPLSDAAREEIQAQLDGVYKIFAGHVASMRGVSMTKFEDKMGQGREFLGEAAVASGLADAVVSYDDLMSRIAAEGIDTFAGKAQTPLKFPRGQQMTKQALTEQQIAALAAGGALAAGDDKTPEQLAADKAAADAAAAAAATAAAATAAAAQAALDAAAADAAAKPSTDAVVALLQSQLKAANEQVVALTVEKTTLTAQAAAVEATKATHAGLLKIAAGALKNMKVALGFSGFDASTLSAEQLLAEHGTTSEQFASKFKVGGVASVIADSAAGKEDATEVARQEQLRAAVQANRYGRK